MLRNNTETFAPEFAVLLARLGIGTGELRGFQLCKFERIEPDVFAWMLRGSGRTYVVTIVDGGSDAPEKDFLAGWGGGFSPKDYDPLDA